MDNKIFALIDCNNFYCSCERAFNPSLKNKPVAVLSNNDGCIVARSDEVKALGIPMGAPFHEYENIIKKEKVVVFSSNYSLYGDMSKRVMDILSTFTPAIEIYSIDEAFLDFTGFRKENLEVIGRDIRETVLKWTGIPVSVGFSLTKTLAKVANRIAKKEKQKGGVFLMLDENAINDTLPKITTGDIWGIGRKLAPKLESMGIKTAFDLKKQDPHAIRRIFSVVMQRTVMELNGISCIEIEEAAPSKKQILTSRSFGKKISEYKEVEQAVAWHTTRASEKLRQQGLRAGLIIVFITTNPFSKVDVFYQNSFSVQLEKSSKDTGELINYAINALKKIYKKGYFYHKCGVILTVLKRDVPAPATLFNETDPVKEKKSEDLMLSIDNINKKLGKSTVKYAAEGLNQSWKMRSTKKSLCYTTKWEELKRIR